jgi:hypothetical protein
MLLLEIIFLLSAVTVLHICFHIQWEGVNKPNAKINVTLLSIFINYMGYQIKKNEMGGVCVTYGGEEGSIQGFG